MRIFSVLVVTLFSLLVSQVSLAKPVPIENYARLPAIYDAAISPNGNYLAMVNVVEGQYVAQIFNIGNPADQAQRVVALSDGQLPRWLKWANNEVLLMSIGQEESNIVTGGYGGARGIYTAGFIYTWPVNGQPKILVEADKKSRATQFNFSYVIDFLSNDPDHILMGFSREALRGNASNYGGARSLSALQSNGRDVQKVNVRSGKSKVVERPRQQHTEEQKRQYVSQWITDSTGKVRIGSGIKYTSLRQSAKDDEELDVFFSIKDAVSGDIKYDHMFPGLSDADDILGFTENPNELVISSYNNKDTIGVYVYDLIQKRQTRKLFHHDQYDATGLVRSWDGKRIVGIRYIADANQIHFLDAAYKNKMTSAQSKLPGFHISFIDEMANGNKILIRASSPTRPPHLLMLDNTRGKLTSLGGYYPELGNTAQGNVQKANYKARDGLEIPAFMTLPAKLPKGAKPSKIPFVVMPHGGPYARDALSYDYFAQIMASRGYGVLQMNFRGSEGYGKAFREAGRGNWEVMQDDVEDGARWLIKQGYADTKRICIVGWSFGGYSALMGAIDNGDIYKCAASIAGVTDLKDLVKDTKRHQSRFAANYSILKGFDGDKALKKNSPVLRAGEIKIPLFLAHGTKDVNVRFDQFTRMKSALKKAGVKNVTTIVLKDGDHSLRQWDNRIEMFTKLDKFLEKNLGKSKLAP